MGFHLLAFDLAAFHLLKCLPYGLPSHDSVQQPIKKSHQESTLALFTEMEDNDFGAASSARAWTTGTCVGAYPLG
ncbi:uncharacterized protein N7482_001069 [Penicillium canariense]|uniref:Uncharacterized protein n=1 Tax=Penicillium canariense TaxID=189055 RepID=A0A9W9IEY6_9EURO|nr:uncharacterized protein N7482_001069 [Penicillium canariense]KAJ5175192.1 hypothetical protein N7482_001069 [Penicillium canariense]